MSSTQVATRQSDSARRLRTSLNLAALVQARWLAPALLALAGFALYGRALGFDFVSDDAEQVLQNPYVRNPHLWTRIFTTSVWSFEGRAVQTNFYRPLQIFCYWALDRLAGPQPLVFHLLNLAAYIAGAVLVFYIGARLFGKPLPAFLAALLWIAHPLHVEAAAWVAALPDLGFGFFYLLAFLIFLRAEQTLDHPTRGYALSAVAFFPALFFKESAVSFPLLLVAFWFFKPFATARRNWKHRGMALGFCGIAIAVAAAARIAALGHLLGGRKVGHITYRVLASALGLLGENAKIFFYPAHLSIFRTFTPAGSLHSPWTWIAVSLVAAAVLSRRHAPLAGFLVCWWFVALIPCLDVRQLSIPYVADRFSYIPSVGLCLAIVCLAIGSDQMDALHSRRARIGAVVLAAVAAAWAVQTSRVLPNWRSDGALTQYSAKLYPSNPALHLVEGWKLAYHYGDLNGADREYRQAFELNRANSHPLDTITYEALIGLGQDFERRGNIDEALAYIQQAISLLPNLGEAYQVLGSVYFPRRNYARAALYFEKAANLDPMDPSAHFYLGTCWLKMGLNKQAAEQLHTATEIDPTLRAAYVEEAEALKAARGVPAAVPGGRAAPAP